MMICRQRGERLSSNLTSLMREHNRIQAVVVPAPAVSGLGNSSSSSSSSSLGRERLLGVSSLNQSATMSLFDFDREFIEEEVWGASEDLSVLPDEQFAQQPQRGSTTSANSSSSSKSDAENLSNRVSSISKWFAGSASSSRPLSRIQIPESSNSNSSKPMNVPDWSTILQSPNKSRGSLEEDHDSDKENDDQEWVPPHTLAARQDEARIRTSSIIAFSVLEGAGRTLKGRDLSRVRNAVWKQTGYMAV